MSVFLFEHSSRLVECIGIRDYSFLRIYALSRMYSNSIDRIRKLRGVKKGVVLGGTYHLREGGVEGLTTTFGQRTTTFCFPSQADFLYKHLIILAGLMEKFTILKWSIIFPYQEILSKKSCSCTTTASGILVRSFAKHF